MPICRKVLGHNFLDPGGTQEKEDLERDKCKYLHLGVSPGNLILMFKGSNFYFI